MSGARVSINRIDRADLFGFSLGSPVSIEMAVTYPARVDRLVLASGLAVLPGTTTCR